MVLLRRALEVLDDLLEQRQRREQPNVELLRPLDPVLLRRDWTTRDAISLSLCSGGEKDALRSKSHLARLYSSRRFLGTVSALSSAALGGAPGPAPAPALEPEPLAERLSTDDERLLERAPLPEPRPGAAAAEPPPPLWLLDALEPLCVRPPLPSAPPLMASAVVLLLLRALLCRDLSTTRGGGIACAALDFVGSKMAIKKLRLSCGAKVVHQHMSPSRKRQRDRGALVQRVVLEAVVQLRHPRRVKLFRLDVAPVAKEALPALCQSPRPSFPISTLAPAW